ncbi:MAG TPA: ABC transporter ATP-binding protein, partial [Trueperaceae bacterium]|nr:ABC transporter ATP-binding protein [Trueperaceae bacterium]
SGCGKTTLLRLIAGFERLDGGSVEVAGKVVASEAVMTRPEHRRIGFVFQDFALFPHLTVLDNVAFGLSGTRAEKRARAAEVLALVGLTVFDSRFPHQLSGGQQQRVALARALAPQPHILLLDEPFSNLDASLRGSTRDEVRSILARSGITVVMVTHDQEEALAFGDRVAVMRDGRIEQVGTPEQVYFHPGTAFVASFLGRTNLLRGLADGRTATTTIGAVPLSGSAEGRVIISLRPDHLELVPAAHALDAAGNLPPRGTEVRATVVRREFKGHVVTYEAIVSAQARGAADAPSVPEERLVVFASPDSRLAVGDEALVRVTGDGVTLQRGASAGD